MRQPAAKFAITSAFKITGRGLVFAGLITEGIISTGDLIELKALGKVYYKKITGVSGIRSITRQETHIGLLIECDNEAEINALNGWDFENEAALIFKGHAEHYPGQ